MTGRICQNGTNNMLEVYCGNDVIQVREQAFAAAEKHAADATLTVLDTDTYASGALNDAVGATSLFGGGEIYILDTPSSNEDFAAETKELLDAMAPSTNTFVVIEGALLAAAKKPYQKYASVFEEIKGEKAERFNTFAMADALARKDKKSLWLLLQDATRAGIAAEEIIGILWWQLKSLRLAATTKSAAEAGMKDFPYNKAKRSLSKFKDGELVALSHSLLVVYHDGHAGMRDIDLSLERWLLTL